MAEEKMHVTIDGKDVSSETTKKVHESLRKTLQDELAKEHSTSGGTAAPAISGHAQWITRLQK